ncbi:MAG: alcohol dehydrogenase catalytic domain-containing protein, partial [Clostridia bacterium]|nr:alcohol dehydrogenase catalytic domain-containing protein [Clostridia bacterium]
MKRMRLVEIEHVIIEEVEKPVPQKDEVLIKVAMVGVCGTDIHAYYGRHPYIKCPIVLGHEFSGIVESTGEGVEGIKTGSKVTVIPHLGCGKCEPCLNKEYNRCEELKCIGCQATGAYAEYITVPAKVVVPMPESMSFEQGAFVEPASVAYHGVKRGMKPGDIALIMGAGPIGIMAMQFAKELGAKMAVIADFKQNRLDLAKALGADGIINLNNEALECGLERILGSPKKV